VLVSETARLSLGPVLEAMSPGVPVYVCGRGDFFGITGHDIHRGCLALVERPPQARLQDVVPTAANARRARSGDQRGQRRQRVPQRRRVWRRRRAAQSKPAAIRCNRKAIRTSMGATLGVPFARVAEWPAGLSGIRSAGFAIVALTPREHSETLDAFASRSPSARLALLVGAREQA